MPVSSSAEIISASGECGPSSSLCGRSGRSGESGMGSPLRSCRQWVDVTAVHRRKLQPWSGGGGPLHVSPDDVDEMLTQRVQSLRDMSKIWVVRVEGHPISSDADDYFCVEATVRSGDLADASGSGCHGRSVPSSDR